MRPKRAPTNNLYKHLKEKVRILSKKKNLNVYQTERLNKHRIVLERMERNLEIRRH